MANTFRGFTFDREAGTLVGPDGPVMLRPKTLALLDLLSSNRGRAMSKDELLASVWAEVTVTEDTLTQTIHELRKALGDAGPALIRTVPRRGYLFDAEPERPGKAGITLSVLPFANQSSDPEQQYFADGLTTDIEAALDLIAELTVLPVRDGTTSARYVLTGTVRADGEHIRVTTRLTDTVAERAIWNGRFDGARTEIFSFQDEITRTVAVTLQIELTTGDFARLWDGQTKSLAAWERMVRARRLDIARLDGYALSPARASRAMLRSSFDVAPPRAATFKPDRSVSSNRAATFGSICEPNSRCSMPCRIHILNILSTASPAASFS